MVKLRSLVLGIALATGFMTAPARAELHLVMFEQDGCHYCIKWDNEIGPIYSKTAEGRTAPLKKVHLREDWKSEITLTKGRPAFTPTFVLIRDGVEQARLEGYPGEDFFWGLIAKMIEKEPEWQAQLAENDSQSGG